MSIQIEWDSLSFGSLEVVEYLSKNVILEVHIF
jgi:hypothetical protein